MLEGVVFRWITGDKISATIAEKKTGNEFPLLVKDKLGLGSEHALENGPSVDIKITDRGMLKWEGLASVSLYLQLECEEACTSCKYQMGIHEKK